MEDDAKRLIGGTVFVAVAACCLWLGMNFQGVARILLVALAVLVAMPAIAAFFGPRVLGGVIAIALSGALFGGAVALAGSKTTAIQVIGCIFAYITWLGFSACVFGVPVIVIPFPPFFIFAWQKLSEEQKKEMLLRFLAIGLTVGIAAGVTNLPRWRTKAHTMDAGPTPAGDAPTRR